MKYCYNCNRITEGTPLFCNFCGRSYNVKLCPRHHVNPRGADACSKCGNRDLSTPQPKVPWWTSLFQSSLLLVPSLAFGGLSILIVVLFIQEVGNNPRLIFPFVFLGIAMAMISWAWTQVPKCVRNFIYRLLKRKRDGDDGRRGG